jgi:hypothetical protein
MMSLRLIRAAAACEHGEAALEDPKDMVPFLDFTPDGKGRACG